jgi:hypothetical protein
MGGRTQKILGSAEIRGVAGFSVGLGKDEPKFRFGKIPAQLVWEAYRYGTDLQSAPGASPTRTWNFGGLAIARYRWPMDAYGNGMFFDLGFGVQFVNRVTFDLQSTINTTPMLGFGGVFKSGNDEVLIGLRLLHISNGGRVKPNRGDNILFLTFGIRFAV